MVCSDIAMLSINDRGQFMPNELTSMEAKAIRFARTYFADALATTGLMEPFANANAQQIDTLIEACWRGCRRGMAEQSEVPF